MKNCIKIAPRMVLSACCTTPIRNSIHVFQNPSHTYYETGVLAAKPTAVGAMSLLDTAVSCAIAVLLHSYIPIGLLDVVPQQLHWRAASWVGRSDLETLLSSDHPSDWIRVGRYSYCADKFCHLQTEPLITAVMIMM
jgi:hypothetical protein